MLNPKHNVGKLRNDILMALFAYFKMVAKNHGIGHITTIFYFLTFFLIQTHKYYVLIWNFSYIESKVWAAFYIIIQGYHRIHGNTCLFRL